MKLRNNFTIDTRKLYIDWWECFLCGGNGQNCGGLEIHHILSRVSNSPFNSSCLCIGCHKKVGHSQEEHKTIFKKTLLFLEIKQYKATQEDYKFLDKHLKDLI
jgi:hypothetical protein